MVDAVQVQPKKETRKNKSEGGRWSYKYSINLELGDSKVLTSVIGVTSTKYVQVAT